jgi:hypothetical protein
MFAQRTTKNARFFGYTGGSLTSQIEADAVELYRMAARDKCKKLVIFGGLHG